jgi:cellulose biosynthesis protein BcsQ
MSAGTIVTFYSYKGGVGRSMAVANVALLLARRGQRVLIVDWDLEAPGIERYFSYFEISAGGPGLLRLLIDARDGKEGPDYRGYCSTIALDSKHPIKLLASGRDRDPSYSADLETFDWTDFFHAGGGVFMEELRNRWRTDFDVVLVDSRTGLSDAGGVCTIQLPDVVVAMFTANYQSLYGVRDVMRLAQQARQKLAYDRMPLSILPLPSRWGVSEFQETRIWLDRVVEGVGEFFDDWLPRPLTPRDVVEAVKIPHHPYFSFGERLAVIEQGASDPQGLGFAYGRVADFLASGFRDVAGLVGKDLYQKVAEHQLRAAPPVPRRSRDPSVSPGEGEDGYRYDIFVSYEHSAAEWVHNFIEILRKHLNVVAPAPVRLFLDTHELQVGSWEDQIAEALERSKVLLALLTPAYQRSKTAAREWEAFHRRSTLAGEPLICPVLLRGPRIQMEQEFAAHDFRNVFPSLMRAQDAPAELHRAMADLSERLFSMIAKAPPLGETRKNMVRR